MTRPGVDHARRGTSRPSPRKSGKGPLLARRRILNGASAPQPDAQPLILAICSSRWGSAQKPISGALLGEAAFSSARAQETYGQWRHHRL